MMKKTILIILFFIAVNSTKAQAFNPLLASMLQDTLSTYLAFIPDIKGMSASVYIPGQGLWQGTGGLSYAGQPITSDMEFGIASNTKLFVATAMLKLVDNNIISLDDPLSTWLPAYPNINSNITIRQLLNHTSGVQDPIFLPPWIDTIMANPTRVFTPVEVLSWVAAPTFPAGTSWGYSNINYILAAMIAESATGFHISQIIRDSILTPLNLDPTFYDVEEAEIGIIAHRWFNTIDYHDTSRVALNTAGAAAGALFSTSSEMAQWYNALFNNQLLSPSSMDELTNFVATGNPTYTYGLGVRRETTQGYTYWGHAGDTWGYKSKMMYDTCNGTVVCGFSNSFPSGMSAVTFLLYRTVINHIPGCSDLISGTNTVCQGENSVVYTISPIGNATSYTWTLPSGATGTSNTNTISVDYGLDGVSGDIVVSGVNNYGAGGTSKLWVTVNPKPATPVITQNEGTLSSNYISGNQWYNSAGLINGATNQNYVVTAIDDYYVIVTILGCSSDDSNVINATLTGTQENVNNEPIKIYPNPVSNELTIEIEGNNEVLNFEILNTIGQVFFKGNLVEKTTVQTNNFTHGVYLIKFKNGEIFELKKLIKA